MNSTGQLKREVGVFGAVMLGLGSILGTGVFVSIGIGAGIAGPGVLMAIVLAAMVATCNALSSAQLAAAHPVSGGTYEYGYRLIHPLAGFTAGWMFMAAKSASAATAALGLAGYLLISSGMGDSVLHVPLAVGFVVALTLLVLGGLRRSNLVNVAIVSVTILSLLVLVVVCFGRGAYQQAVDKTVEAGAEPFGLPLLQATAIMFVAYTGYGRIATLGEEVRDPRRSIPKAIITTLIVSALLYVGVGIVVLGFGGVLSTDAQAAPLEVIARAVDLPALPTIIAVGAITAMLGVLLNLILGLSRVLLAMGRRGDVPGTFGHLNRSGTTPTAAVIAVGVIIGGLALIGDVKTTWTFSAFTVLIYYGLTNLAALRLPPEHRLYPRLFAWCGLIACFGLAFFVPWQTWAFGLGLIAAGGLWYAIARRLRLVRKAD